MVLSSLGCTNNTDFEKKIKKINDSIVLDVFIILSEVTTRTNNLKNTVLVHAYRL